MNRASVVLFPGQGSQYVGMVQNLNTRGKQLFQVASELLKFDLLKLCNEGPHEQLDRTIFSQPAVFVSSLAAAERLAVERPEIVSKCRIAAGFSLGEIAALVFAKSIDFVEALEFIKLRSELTQELSDRVPSGMMTVLYGHDHHIKQACSLAKEFCIRSGIPEKESVCCISNYLFPNAKIIAGHQVALNFIEENKTDFGIKRVKRLAVSGAFHTSLMHPARKKLWGNVQLMKIKEPTMKVYSNVDAKPCVSPERIRYNLSVHLSKPVLWEQILHKIYEDDFQPNELPTTFECGPQKQMTTMLGMVNKKAQELATSIEP